MCITCVCEQKNSDLSICTNYLQQPYLFFFDFLSLSRKPVQLGIIYIQAKNLAVGSEDTTNTDLKKYSPSTLLQSDPSSNTSTPECSTHIVNPKASLAGHTDPSFKASKPALVSGQPNKRCQQAEPDSIFEKKRLVRWDGPAQNDYS